MADFEDKLKETLESAKEGLSEVAEVAKDEFQNVVSEGKEVVEEAKATVTGQKLETDVEGAAGYRADESTNSTLSIIALVVGILSIIFAFAYTWVGLVLGIVGIVLGAKARKQSQTKMATAGFVCSIIGLVLSAVFVVCALACAASLIAAGGLAGLKG